MKKLRNKKGFTLAEMLISVMLLGFVSVMVAVMTSAILNSTVTMREVAQAEVLGSEALDNLQGQLRVAKNVTVATDGNVRFDIDDANKDYTFDIEDGKIVLGKEEGGKVSGGPLFSGVSYGNLRVTDLQFTGDGARETIEVFVEISFGERALWNGKVTVRPLNGMTII